MFTKLIIVLTLAVTMPGCWEPAQVEPAGVPVDDGTAEQTTGDPCPYQDAFATPNRCACGYYENSTMGVLPLPSQAYCVPYPGEEGAWNPCAAGELIQWEGEGIVLCQF